MKPDCLSSLRLYMVFFSHSNIVPIVTDFSDVLSRTIYNNSDHSFQICASMMHHRLVIDSLIRETYDIVINCYIN
jgi:hypothetical protein